MIHRKMDRRDNKKLQTRIIRGVRVLREDEEILV